MKLLILSAFVDECLQFKNQMVFTEKKINNFKYFEGLYDSHNVYLAMTGIGTIRSSATATMLCSKIKPDIVLFIGTAGGLKPDQKTGDILIGSHIIDIDLIHLPDVLKNTPYAPCLIDPHLETPLDFNYQLNPQLLNHFISLDFENVSSAIIATSNTFPAPIEALEIMKNMNSLAIEMENSGVCYAAQVQEIPFVAIRAISNNIDANGVDLGTPDDALKQCASRLAAFMDVILNKINLLENVLGLSKGKKIYSNLVESNF
ncbi:MAG: 5'-methylthioadenosine/S-adenosylhomocysteine nucleosidase [Legionellales bacterium]|nr:5'-methylthioadenosine/S-adenosylhomocysteine nucleosidase [Legionellales bacterium]